MASQIITLDEIKRFDSKCVRDANGCLVWTGARFDSGYGAFKLKGQERRAHRVAWQIAYGAIPKGKYVLHACDNRACVEQLHLFIGDHASNMADMVMKGRAASRERNGAMLRRTTKLSPSDIVSIRAYLAAGVYQRRIAEIFGVTQSNISSIQRGLTWAQVN